MKVSFAASAGIVGLSSAQHAAVLNNCQMPIYVQSFPYNGGHAGPLTTLKPGATFSEKFVASGSTVKIAKAKTLDHPLFFGYSFTSDPDYAYYEFSTEFGNPFAASHNVLSPGAGCEEFDCKANDGECYSRPGHKKVYGCPQPVDLVAEICK